MFGDTEVLRLWALTPHILAFQDFLWERHGQYQQGSALTVMPKMFL